MRSRRRSCTRCGVRSGAAAPPPLLDGRERCDHRIGASDEPPFAAIRDLQVIEQRGGQGR